MFILVSVKNINGYIVKNINGYINGFIVCSIALISTLSGTKLLDMLLVNSNILVATLVSRCGSSGDSTRWFGHKCTYKCTCLLNLLYMAVSGNALHQRW